jgi:transposase
VAEVVEAETLDTGLADGREPVPTAESAPTMPANCLVTAGQHPERLRGEAAFAHLCGTAPIPASSGTTHRHRLHRGGDRDVNRALHLAVVFRMRWCPRTRAYAQRRTKEGMPKPEIMRCVKRDLAHEGYHALVADFEALTALDDLYEHPGVGSLEAQIYRGTRPAHQKPECWSL